MRAFLFAVAAIVVVSVGANIGLTSLDFSSASVNSTDAVRLGN